MQPPEDPMNFEEWQRIATKDPESFERLRRQCIDEAIARAPADRQDRLRRLQWRIEQTRERAGSPLGACMAISKLMWQSLAGKNGLVDALKALPSPKPPSKGKLLDFIRKEHP